MSLPKSPRERGTIYDGAEFLRETLQAARKEKGFADRNLQNLIHLVESH
jgi:hypothetical protein